MKKYFKLLRYQIRKKSNYIVAIIVALLVTLVTMLTSYQKSWYNSMEEEIQNGYSFRSLTVGKKFSSEEERINQYKELQNVEHIQAVIYNNEHTQNMRVNEFNIGNDDESNMSFTYIYNANNQTLPKIIKGTNFPDDDNYYMVCPQNYVKNIAYTQYSSKNEIKDLSSLVNKTLTFTYYDDFHTKKFVENIKLVGIYKNSKYLPDEDLCYVNDKTIHDIVVNRYNGDLESYKRQKYIQFIVIIDSYKNIDKVKDSLSKLGYRSGPTSYYDVRIINSITNKINIGVLIITGLAFLFVFLIYQKDYKEDKKYYNLLYKTGYNLKDIKLLYILTMILKIVLYLITSIIFTILMFIILKIVLYYYPFMLDKMQILLSIKGFIIAIVIFIINVIINIILHFRKLI